MQFPLQITFKILALAPQMYVQEASGRQIGYVRQKLMAFKESVTVFTDDTQARPIYTINADRVIDFTANYHFADASGRPLGRIRREGMRSLWRAHYVISVGDRPAFEVYVHPERVEVRAHTSTTYRSTASTYSPRRPM